MLLDVDFFKRINDTRGHAAGDAVLVEVTRRLQGLLRDEDAVVRWGGEEFLLVLPGTSADGQDAVARRVLDAISATPVTVEGSPIPVTVSAGCIVWPLFPGQSCDEAVHVADLALYESKRGGRHRATCVGRLSVGADHERLRSDLPAAAAAGDVELTTVIPAATEASAAQRLVAESWRSASPSSAIH